MHEALNGLSVEADVQALDNVRAYVQKASAAATLERELGSGDETTQRIRELRREAIAEGARLEFEELKRAHALRSVPAHTGPRAIAAPVASA
jgi:phage shock protein A